MRSHHATSISCQGKKDSCFLERGWGSSPRGARWGWLVAESSEAPDGWSRRESIAYRWEPLALPNSCSGATAGLPGGVNPSEASNFFEASHWCSHLTPDVWAGHAWQAGRGTYEPLKEGPRSSPLPKWHPQPPVPIPQPPAAVTMTGGPIHPLGANLLPRKHLRGMDSLVRGLHFRIARRPLRAGGPMADTNGSSVTPLVVAGLARDSEFNIAPEVWRLRVPTRYSIF